MLSINGTPNGDTVAVKQLRTHLLQVQVTFNRKLSPKYSMADFRRVVFYGGEGNDTFTMGLARPTSLHGEGGNDRLTGGGGYDEIFGGKGNDTLSGANGNDILVGGEGVDNLSGGGGRDILIGGLGGDTLNGGADDDILVGGTTDYDTNQAALAAVLAEWGTRDTFANRTNKLNLLVGSSLSDDFAKDKFTGGTGSDWHLNFLLDTISGFSSKADKKRL
jgi:Ca2+-binding RTX toxin-like protein